jgi:hypothetical protein
VANCKESVYTDSYTQPMRPCSRKAGPSGYCGQHDPKRKKKPSAFSLRMSAIDKHRDLERRTVALLERMSSSRLAGVCIATEARALLAEWKDGRSG